MSLGNMSRRLAQSGDEPNALKACREAVEIRRRLAKANPTRFEPDLSMSLIILSDRLSAADDRTGAYDAAREAVEISRRVVQLISVSYEPDLAHSLECMSRRQIKIDDPEGALISAREALAIFERLSSADPARFVIDRANCYGSVGWALEALGYSRDAHLAYAEGVQIVEPFARDAPSGSAKRSYDWLCAARDRMAMI